jgi:hypothetical protein
MSTDYTGVGTSTQAPSPVPSVNNDIIVRLPTAADAFSETAHYQALKTCADNDAYLKRRLLVGREFLFDDDFLGDTLNRSKWLAASVSGTGAVSVVGAATDAAGMGALQLAPGTGTATVSTQTFLLTGRKFRLAALMRYSAFTTGDYGIGVYWLAAGNRLQFITQNAGNWQAWYGTTPTTQTLGVAPSTSYQLLELVYDGTTAYWYIDGVLKHSVAFTLGTAAQAYISVGASGTACTAFCDVVKFWTDR